MDYTAPVLPETQTAIVANGSGELVITTDAPLPSLGPDMLLLRNVAVAINPVDVKLTGLMASKGATAGSDCAGIVVAVGRDVAAHHFAPGDRVCAPLPAMNPLAPRIGAFAEYVCVWSDFALKVPSNMPLESAAALGIGTVTIGYALFHSLRIPGYPDKPTTKPTVVLVYGGSTASGTMAIQLIRKAGCIPITTCSPRNFALVESYGAEKAFDYHDIKSAEDIRAYTHNALDYVLDCYCEGSSTVFCYNAIGRAGGRYTTLEPYPEHVAKTRRRVKPEWILGPALLGEKVGWKEPYTIEANPELRAFGREWFQCAQRLLDRGELRPHPVRIGDKLGFEGVLDGIGLVRQKGLSAEKLVYRVGR
ncbi:hypothetical protein VPNG_06635 [Cytospora leucostoma]|uniref:Enoyl reductase (ER) domain-containing protein n=1 Tax=Cytospora leucostoma TaxID=1230097 RepID=A0A423WU47_9PEZI|nr:hypothetical protein VPNG_06635 [Cytospora leucostoma]